MFVAELLQNVFYDGACVNNLNLVHALLSAMWSPGYSPIFLAAWYSHLEAALLLKVTTGFIITMWTHCREVIGRVQVYLAIQVVNQAKFKEG